MNQNRFATLDLLLALTLACCIARLWIMPLSSSFWVDEMGTYFLVHHAGDPCLPNASRPVAEGLAWCEYRDAESSIYYALPKFAEKIAGVSEAGYRFFSVLAMLAALAVIGRIAARLIHPHAAWFATFACMASRGVNYQADDARPYALGTFILAASVLLLVRWLDSGRWRDGLIFSAAASLLWWVHLIFWPFYLVFAVYAMVRILRGETAAGWRQAVVMFALTDCAVLPVAIRAAGLLHNASTHVIAARPDFRQFLLLLKANAVILTCVAAFVLNRIFKWSVARTAWASPSSLALILSWWLIDPICLFAFSRLSGTSIFVERYLYPALPGAALAAGMLAAIFVPATRWKPLALALGLAVLALMGNWKQFSPPHHNSDWRAAASALRQWTAGENLPVICPSPFIEAQPPVWTPDYPPQGFLYSNLTVYETPGRIYPFPFLTSPAVEEYARHLSIGTLAAAGRFAIYGQDRSAQFWWRWFAARPELRGWQNRRLGSFGDVEAVAFSRAGV